jgi:hypothetical protein
MSQAKKISVWIAAVIAAIIMLQTLFFKFTAAPESIYIFSTLGIEPWGRIGSGVIELIASILLFVPTYRWIGAFLGLGTMVGAIISHLTVLGIEVQKDGGLLFIYAIIVLLCCTFVLWTDRQHILKRNDHVRHL